MVWINYLFYALLLTGLTGSVFTLLWWVLRRLLLRRDAELGQKYLKWVLLLYIVPVLFMILTLWHRDTTLIGSYTNLVKNQMFVKSPVIMRMICIMMYLWFAGMLVMAVHWIRCTLSLRKTLLGSVPEEEQSAYEIFAEVKEELGITKQITLLRNDEIVSPFTTGLIHPVVVLPFWSYSDRELRLILTHELIHCRERHMLLKLAGILVNTIHVWNPLAYLLRGWTDEIVECVCDAHVRDCRKELFDTKEYFSIILNEAAGKRRMTNYFHMSAAESVSGLRRRITNMKELISKGAVKKSVAVASLIFFVLGGSMTAYAAGEGVVRFHQLWYENTKLEIEEEPSTGAVEHVVLPEDVEDVPTDIMDDGIEAYTTTVNINWNVPAGRKVKTGAIYLEAGSTFEIAFGSTPEDKTVRIGLEYPDGSEHYVDCTKKISHSFSIPESGYYNFYVYNGNSQVTVNVSGSYII